ncbi:MAG TPA: ribosome-binding factor A [Candidatus Saccharimonadales bacterium]|nr:ribosome-binding factor A [Candidatus Saccharimonadales bacterium]
MPSKVERLNQAIKKALGEILLKELPDTQPLVVTDFLISSSLQDGRVFLHTTPAILKRVEEKRPVIQASLKTYVKTRLTPVLTFVIDDNYLEHLDRLFEEIEK